MENHFFFVLCTNFNKWNSDLFVPNGFRLIELNKSVEILVVNKSILLKCKLSDYSYKKALNLELSFFSVKAKLDFTKSVNSYKQKNLRNILKDALYSWTFSSTSSSTIIL